MDFNELSHPVAPLVRTPPPGPESLHHLEIQSRREGAAVSYPRGLPMAVRKARGATVEDVDGNIYIDFFGGAGVMNVGHSNPAVLKAAREQMDLCTHFLDIPTPSRTEYVEKLMDLFPPGINKISFGGPTGSDAVESAMKLARLNTRRSPMVAFEGGYHGMSSGALSLTSASSFKDDALPSLPDVHFAPYPYCYRCPLDETPEACDLACLGSLERRLGDPHSGLRPPAAVIVEAVQGEGGSIVPPAGFLRRLRRICESLEILLIVDEIQTGFGRTGRMFAFEEDNIEPDIITLSKALGGGGFPLSAIAYSAGLDIWDPGKHIGTFRGHVVAFAAGRAALDFTIEHDLPGHATLLGRHMLARLKKLEESSPLIGDVRGRGLMIGVELVLDKTRKTPSPESARRLREVCHRNGLLIEIGGHFDNVARFLPPLVLSRTLADKGLDVFEQSLRTVERS